MPVLLSLAVLAGCGGGNEDENARSDAKADTASVPPVGPAKILMFIDLSASMKAEELRIQRARIEGFMDSIPGDWKLTCFKISDELYPEPLFKEIPCITQPFQDLGQQFLKDFRQKRVDTVMYSVDTLLAAHQLKTPPGGDERPDRPSCVTGALTALLRRPKESYDENTYVIFFGDMLEECELADVGRVDLNEENGGVPYFKALNARVDSLYQVQGQLADRLPPDHLTFVVTCKNIGPGRGVLAEGVDEFWEEALDRFGYRVGALDMFVGSGGDAAVRFWSGGK